MRPSDTIRRDGYVPPCIPTRAYKAPAGADWVHETKHDGYRLQVRRVGDAVRLFTRRGYDWSGRYPAIAVTATLLRARSFTLDGEAVVCGLDGVAIFDALHRRGTVTEAMMYAFDLLELDGQDLRTQPLVERRKRLARFYWAGPPARHRPQRPHRRRRRAAVRPRVPYGPGRHRVEAAERALPVGRGKSSARFRPPRCPLPPAPDIEPIRLGAATGQQATSQVHPAALSLAVTQHAGADSWVIALTGSFLLVVECG
jgi:hypothetical protein